MSREPRAASREPRATANVFPSRLLAARVPRLAAAAIAFTACSQSLKFAKDDSKIVLSHQTLMAPNPSEPGTYAVKRMYYGSGTDRNRPEYKDSVSYKTKPVDVSPYASVGPAQANDRKAFWGFDMKAVPIQGRVWYPDGPGPFPLVLVVHGNHNPEDFSDPGYGYLGELLASRGFILVSVDENFINGLQGENDGRAWLLLKHFEVWKRWNDSSAGPMSHKVDFNNLGIMGHSRGGEAVGHAAAFNNLKYYPDDAKQKWNFHFNIKAVVAIAPVDGQYTPASQLTPVENINYLLIHGSHDGDVSTFSGMRTYERVHFTDGQPHFKALMFMYRANHGQWNTVWNNKDNGPRSGRSLDLRTLISPEEQRQFGKLVISAFLETTLHGKKEYLPMFRDYRVAGSWFPKTMYESRFEESGTKLIAGYDEDVDLTTGSVKGVSIDGDSLQTWKENVLPFRGRGTDNQRNQAVWLGWNSRIAGPDTMKMSSHPASYTITLSDSLVRAWKVTDQSAILLSLTPTKDKPGPRAAPRDTTKRDTSKAAVEARRKAEQDSIRKLPKPPKPNPAADTLPIDLSVVLTDAGGNVARLPLSKFGTVRKPLEAYIYRREGRDSTRFASLSELILQTFVMPVSEFVKVSPEFDASRLKSIKLLFDRTYAGTVVLDDVGISPTIDKAYLAAPLP